MTDTPSVRVSNEDGQSIIEFILASGVVIALVFGFVRFCYTLGWASYVQYATFMSARAYLAAGPSDEDQVDRAQEVLTKMLKSGGGGADKAPLLARGIGGGSITGAEVGPGKEFSPDDRRQSWMQGVRYTFRARVLGVRASTFEMTSESWLGREPSEDRCLSALKPKWELDNGC